MTATKAAREFRFGVCSGDRCSQYWKVRANASSPDLYISSSRTGRFLHLSAHEDPQHSHVKVTFPDEEVTVPWSSTDAGASVPLLTIFVPPSGVLYPAPPRRKIAWVVAPEDPERWVAFRISRLQRDASEPPLGRLLGAVVLNDDTSAVVTAFPAAGTSGTFTGHLRAGMPRDAVLEAYRDGGLRALVHGHLPDGSLYLLELSQAPPQSAA
jgi:hypothetical protein